MTEPQKGLFALICANLIWGLSPIYYKVLDHVPAPELLAHRTLWSLIFFGALIAVQGRLFELLAAYRGRVWRMALAAALISFNWGAFIWAIQVERALEASLGYYIFPLISVVLGIMLFGEGRAPGKLIAFGLAMAAVTVLSLGLGAPPWVALLLALSFAGYGVLKKTSGIGPTLSVTAEVLLIAPIALGWLAAVHLGLAPGAAVFGAGAKDSLLLAFSGPLTALPLVLFSYASRRLTLGTLGLVLYLNPTLQLLIAALLFQEPVTLWHMIAVPLIWLALAVYSVDMLRRESRARRSILSVSTS